MGVKERKTASGAPGSSRWPEPVRVLGLPITPITRAQAVEWAGELIRARQSTFFITATLNYAMLAHERPELRELSERAAFLTADGMPLVWASKKSGTPLPERITGSDLIYDLSALAAREGYRVYFLGGAEGVAETAARVLAERYPGLAVAGACSPPFRPASPEEEEELIARIRDARPDLLLVAFGQPKGELWIARYLERLGVPLCVQVGASLDFVSGRVSRAPVWLQNVGLEWAYRLWLEPKRLLGRYARNGLFYLRMSLPGVSKVGA